MKTESRGPTVTYNPNVYVSADELGEDAVYANAEELTVDKMPATSDKMTWIPSIPQSFSPVAVCWGILLLIMALRIHFTTVISAKLSNQMKVSEAADQYIKYVTNDLNLTKENLERDHSNLKVKIDKMAQAYTVLESNLADLSGENQQVKAENQQVKAENQQVKAENQQVKAENQQVKAENQQVKAENEQLTAENQRLRAENQQVKAENQQVKTENQQVKAENQWLKGGQQTTTQIQTENSAAVAVHSRNKRENRIEETLKTMGEWNETSPVWSYYNYFLISTASPPERQREPCQTSWLHFRSSCYAISNRDPPDQKTWEEARDDCRGKNADLVVIESPEEQGFIYNSSLAGLGAEGYWIGLRVEGGGWKWVNGSHLTEDYWMHRPADNHHCVISVKETNGWKAVSCDVEKGWICEKNALSV